MNSHAPLDPEDTFFHRKPRYPDLSCPHCLAAGIRYSSRPLTVTFREVYYACANPLCGHTWKATLSYDYGLSPSAIPDPALNLPMRMADRESALPPRGSPPLPDPDQPGLFDGALPPPDADPAPFEEPSDDE